MRDRTGKAWDIHTASDADAQRRRLDARAKILRPLAAEPRVCVVYGGRGRMRELAEKVAELIGHGRVAMGAPLETIELIRAVTLGGTPPRVVVIAPLSESRPLVEAIRCACQHWPAPVDFLYGVRAHDRVAQLRHIIRTVKNTARGPSIRP